MKDSKNRDTEDNSMAHYRSDSDADKPATYDPDDQKPETTIGVGQGYRDVPLEESDPDKGYSANGGQGKWESTLPLADEDMDRRQSDQQKNEDLQDSYEKMQRNNNKEEGESE
ncbi:hypothetical protein [Telluribacter sp.]|jgi:hypothetical protein|uniref:hypothetical protein n=1 Tax=Telluribacter sp. TaxID=1978767 RepID=UPI002E102D05|nr:hypothetical protein [Telluribacter sp.]